MVVDWKALLFGFSLGVPVGLLFFAGLAWGMRLALRSTRPGALLLLSSVCRIAVLLAGAFWMTFGDTLWPLAGYVLAFFLARVIAVAWARAVPVSTVSARQAR